MSDCGSGTGNNQCNPCGGGNGVGTWTGGGWTGGPIEAGPGLHIQASSTYFNYVNGKLDPPYQMLNFIARISGVESPVTWIAEPGVKTTPNSSTFSIDTEEFGERPFVMLTATAPNGEARSIMLTRAADPLATVGAPAGTPIASKMAEELVADVEDTKNRILSILSAIGSSQSAEEALMEIQILKDVIEAAQGAADEAVLLTDTARDDAIREAQAAANSASVALAYKNQIVEIADGIDEDVATITQQAGIAAAAANAAGTSATAASTSAQTASAKASEAEISATAANAAKVSAETAAGQASTSATNAATSADSAAGSAAAALSSSNVATESKNQAQQAATASSSSSQSAATAATAAEQGATAANTAKTAAETAASNASTSASQASTSAQNAAGSAAAASTSAGVATTSRNQAEGFASAASTSASNAATSATNAGQAATAAQTARTEAQAASVTASVSRDEAVVASSNASNSAAAAQASAILAASTGTASMVSNPGFDSYPSAAVGAVPTAWSLWSGTDHFRVADAFGGWSVRIPAGPGAQSGIQHSHPFTGVIKQGDWIVLEADVTLNSGTFVGAGVHFQVQRENRTAVAGPSLVFATDRDATGNVVGNGIAGRTYTFRKLILIDHPEASSFTIFAMSKWTGIGVIAGANEITWDRVSCRAATLAEIRDQTVLPVVEASVSTLQGAVADINGSAAFLEQKLAASGSNPAMMLMKAGKNGSGVGLIADRIALANIGTNGVPQDALVVENGEVYLAGKLRANSITASQIVLSNRNDVFPDRGFYDLNWHGLQGLAVAGVSGVGVIQPARFLRILSTGGASVDRSSPEVPVEKGATYLIKYHVYVSPDFEGWIGNTIHMPWQAWYTPAPSVNPEWLDGGGYPLLDVGGAVPRGQWRTYVGRFTFQNNAHGDFMNLRHRWAIISGYAEFCWEVMRASDAELIVDGAVTANKINVAQLSALSANIGEATAGVIRSPSGNARFDLNNAQIIFNNGVFMKVTGIGFGSNNQFLEWFGPSQNNLANCTESNGVQWLRTDGAAYFGGTLSAGIISNAVQTTTVSSDNVVMGSFVSNGRPAVVISTASTGLVIATDSNTWVADSPPADPYAGSRQSFSVEYVLERATSPNGPWTLVETFNGTAVSRTETINAGTTGGAEPQPLRRYRHVATVGISASTSLTLAAANNHHLRVRRTFFTNTTTGQPAANFELNTISIRYTEN